MFQVLNQMGIKGIFFDFVKAMYNQITSQIMVNGKLSSKIKISRSIRQGCSLSMLIFVLTSVPILNAIENNKSIKGFKTKYRNELKVMAYADDTTIIVSETKSIKNIEKIFEEFAKASEAKINKDKTEILRLGKWRKHMPNYEQLKSNIKTEVKILGTYFTEYRKDFVATNFRDKISKIDKIIAHVAEREISLFGKVLLVNSMIYSQLCHIGCVVHFEDKHINLVNKKVNKWLNGKGGPNIINKIMKPKENGGAGLINLKCRLQTLKVKALKSLIVGNWTKYFDTIVYWAGTRMQLLSGQDIKGPKSEFCSNKYDDTIKIMVKNREKLNDIHNMKMRDIETILFEQESTVCPYIGIYRGKSVKLISLNFRIATNILKTATILPFTK